MARLPKLSDAEWEVMNVVWEHGPATAQDVHRYLGGVRSWSARTVKTLLGRLVKKRAVAFEVDGRRYLYRARASREACVHAESASFVSRVLGGKASPLVAYFVREGHLTKDEIRQLRALLDAEERS